MEDEPMQINVPTSPELPTNSDIVTTRKGFSQAMTLDLTDEEIKRAMRVVHEVRERHLPKFLAKFNDPNNFTLDDALKAISDYEDEIKTRLAEEVNVLASVDVTPLLKGEPMNIEWLGVLPGGNLDRYGMDHERKAWEVRRANDRGESYLGEHEG